LIAVITTGIKSKKYSRQRQQYWIKGFRIQTSRFCNSSLSLELLNLMHGQNIILCTHSLKYFEITYLSDLTYHFLAVTKAHNTG